VTGDRGWVATLAGAWAQQLVKVLLMAWPDQSTTQSGCMDGAPCYQAWAPGIRAAGPGYGQWRSLFWRLSG